jgi:hypothetical protein
MNSLINNLTKFGILIEDLDYHLIRASWFLGVSEWLFGALCF